MKRSISTVIEELIMILLLLLAESCHPERFTPDALWILIAMGTAIILAKIVDMLINHQLSKKPQKLSCTKQTELVVIRFVLISLVFFVSITVFEFIGNMPKTRLSNIVYLCFGSAIIHIVVSYVLDLLIDKIFDLT